tara:strand:+ start:257 stop:403 length:147 start_codon:yes stop_codon:yes gene_type:complete
MKTKPKIAASAGLASALYIEEGAVWVLDKLFDIGLVYKDAIIMFISNF